MSEKPMSVEEMAKAAAEAKWKGYSGLHLRDKLLYAEAFVLGHAASTRAAVIAELEKIYQSMEPWGAVFLARVIVGARIAQLRAEQGNEQTGEGDNVGS